MGKKNKYTQFLLISEVMLQFCTLRVLQALLIKRTTQKLSQAPGTFQIKKNPSSFQKAQKY